MPTAPVLLSFVLIAFLALLVPGPTVTYVVTRTLENRHLGGPVAACGATSGAIIHALAATVGLAGLLASTPWALSALQWGGASYLVYLGVQQLRKGSTGRLLSGGPPAPTRRLRVFVDGTLVGLLNPKTALFFVALLPQFIDLGRGSPGTQLIVLTLCYVPLAFLVYNGYLFLASRIARGISGTPSAQARINRCTGFVYFAVAAFAVLV